MMIPSLKQIALLAVAALSVFGLPAPPGVGQQEGAPHAEQQVMALEQKWLENEQNPDVLESVLADDFVHVLPQGFITKREQLDYQRKHPQERSGSRHFERLHVRIYGATAVASGIVAEERGYGQPARRTMFTDIFVYRNGEWAAVNAQELPLDSIARSGDLEAHDMQRPDGRKQPVQAASPPKPGPELEKLAFLIGAWNASDTYERNPFAPNGGFGSGVYKTSLGPGGLSLLTDYHYQGPQGESSGHQLLTWDPRHAHYVGYIVTSASPGCTVVTGNWEGPNLVLSGEFETRGMKVQFKEVFSDIANRTMTVRQYNSIDGGPSQLFGTTRFTRQ